MSKKMVESRRERLSMDFDWRFLRGEVQQAASHTHGETYMSVKAGEGYGAANPDFNDAEWRSVDLPHDWVVEGTFVPEANMNHGFLPAGVGWYRKTFVLPAEDAGKRLWLEFDGIFRNASVWLNGFLLRTHACGYTSFDVDISDVANCGGENVLALKVDASQFEGWWYEGGGIYRHVWLTKTDPLHIARWGTFVTSAIATRNGASTAELSIKTEVVNNSDHDVSCELVSDILDSEGRKVAGTSSKQTIPAGSRSEFEQQVSVDDPRLWSLEDPHLYTLQSVVKAARKNVDACETTFGVRTVWFDAASGFFLNGKPLKLKGTCNHQDHAGVGVALPDRVNEFRIERLKDMGSNAYRCAHNPPTPELLDACDRLGMLVMDENRTLGSSPEVLADLESTIRRDRNHPSVIMWSLCNEEPHQETTTGAHIVATMKRLVKKLDPTRPVTMAMNGGWGSATSKVLDVQGCNYFIDNCDNYHRQFPEHPIVGTETASAVSTRGIYQNDPARGYLSAYDVNAVPWGATAEKVWRQVTERPFVSGEFVWTGFDYRGEPTPYQWPCINSHFGIIDICGFPKDTFYYYKAWWRNEPMLHLFPHWNWPGREGQEIDVWCHGNCDQVELFLDGVSLGRKEMQHNSHLEWKVKYEPGTLLARGYRDGKEIATAQSATTGPAAGVRLCPDRLAIRADGGDVSIVAAEIIDAEGRIVAVADNEVRFRVSGDAAIIGVGNGDPSSHEPDKATRRRAFGGRCMAIVQSKRGKPGVITLEAESTALPPVRIVIEAQECELKPMVPSLPSGELIRTWRMSLVADAPPDASWAPQDFDQNTWLTVKVGRGTAGTFAKPGWVLYRAQAAAPAFDAAREKLSLRFHGIEGDAKVFVNGNSVKSTAGEGGALVAPLPDAKPREQMTVVAIVRGSGPRAGITGPVAFERTTR